MRIIALLVLCSLSGIAHAQTAQTAEQCPPTPRAGDFLGCYNGTAAPPTAVKPRTSIALTATERPIISKDSIAASERAESNNPADQKAKYVDILAIENKKLDAKLKTLCRGC